MSEDRYKDWIGDYVDGTLGDSERRLLETHLSACEPCRTMAEDLRRVKDAAKALPRLSPPESAWRRIEVSLRAQESGSFPSRLRPFSSPLAMAASALILIGTVGLFMWWSSFTSRTEDADPAELANYVVNELEQAEKHYVNAITGLEQIVQKEEQEPTLDPQLMAVLNDNLELIEQAIGESRAAAQEDPESIVARESLLGALRNKLTLLQNTIMLINDVRQGRGESAHDLLNEMRDGQGSSNPI